jgi:hypothetical protein
MDVPEQHEQSLADAEDETVFMKRISVITDNRPAHQRGTLTRIMPQTTSSAVQPVVRCHAYTVQMMPWLNELDIRRCFLIIHKRKDTLCKPF